MGDQYESASADDRFAEAPVPDGIPLARPLSAEALGLIRPLDEILLPRSSRLAALADVGLVLALLIIVETIAVSALDAYLAVPDDATKSDIKRVMILPFLPIRTGGIFAIIAFVLFMRRQPTRSIGIHRDGLALNLLLGVAAMTAAYAFYFAVIGIAFLAWPGFIEQLRENASRITGIFPRVDPRWLLFMTLLVGVYEEVFFRGFLMTRLRRVTGSWTAAVVVSTVVFVVPHLADQVPAALVLVTILSLVFSIVTVWRKSLIPAIVGHWLFNLFQFLAMYFLAGDSWQ